MVSWFKSSVFGFKREETKNMKGNDKVKVTNFLNLLKIGFALYAKCYTIGHFLKRMSKYGPHPSYHPRLVAEWGYSLPGFFGDTLL